MPAQGITHKGLVIEEDTGSGALIEIARSGACGGCKEKGACGMTESGSLLVRLKSPRRLKKGDEVTVEISRSEFYRSVGLVYIAPVALMLTAAVAAGSMGFSELLTAVLTLAVPAVYFPVLRLFLKNGSRTRYKIR
ncbi:hypothetical protein EP073_02005 [Geovibrio thiophilus]|uniref:Fis family transcriptional regulator n=1 Tax=Geovibrio thiophilus TaxID=139438 RepID=A0A3R5XVL1_9BACT|nr:SoxR reducing system RseC family protein [Geovibrio thiophilus]QAR32211.1 hypothetical protein EP073_02005 [Geovibrio thiophilus]